MDWLYVLIRPDGSEVEFTDEKQLMVAVLESLRNDAGDDDEIMIRKFAQ